MNAQLEKYFTPVQELNALAVDNVEKIVSLQIKRIEENAKIGVEQLKAAAAVKDVDGLKDYLSNYAEALRQISQHTVEDIRTVFDLGNAFSSEARRIFKDATKVN